MECKKLNIYEFETENKNKYIFDNTLGIVIPSSNGIKYIIKNFDNGREKIVEYLTNQLNLSGNNALNKYNYIKSLIQRGHFYIQDNKKLLDSSDYKRLILKSKGSQLILILTEACNLRCKYCVYSNQYEYHKTYSGKRMDFQTAKTAIDIYMELYNKKRMNGFREIPRISFYGGEPLLEYELIGKIIDYCKEENFHPQFLVTTNGTIFNKKIVELIVNNNFNLTFSLDGNKMNNDRNRVFINGKGTFNEIIKNVKWLQQTRQKRNIDQPLSFACCYDNYTDMEQIVYFFESLRKSFGDLQLILNEVYRYDTKYYDYCKEQLANDSRFPNGSQTFAKSTNKLRKEFLIATIEDRPVTETLKIIFQGLFYYRYKSQGLIGPLGNACVPGDKIAVDPDGNFYICEKATQQYKIGDVRSGILWDNVKVLAEGFVKIRDKYCSNCEVSRICDVCYVHFMRNNKLEFNDEFCIDKKKSIKSTLSILYSTLELNPKAFYLDNGPGSPIFYE